MQNENSSDLTPAEEEPRPSGDLVLQVIAMPADTNAFGDVYGGWVAQKMDLAGSIAAQRVAGGHVATVAMDAMAFLRPVLTGSLISYHTRIVAIGRSSIAVLVEVWSQEPLTTETMKITEAQITYVAIDANRRTRPVQQHS